MQGIVPKVRLSVKQKLLRHMRDCREARLKTRYLIIVNLISGRCPAETARVLSVAPSTIYRVAARFRQLGEVGLLDGREDNGQTKLDEVYLASLYELVRSNPQQQGWRRPTWTREMLAQTLRRQTGVSVHLGTMSRALKMIGARRGRPRPTVGCPWSVRARNRRLRNIRQMLETLPQGHVAVHADELDIDLNPKIGPDWMVRGQQKRVVTPGQNVKRYMAGAMDVRTGRLVWVEAERKNSWLFIALLDRLVKAYPKAKVIHVVLDNFRIHDSRMTRQAVQACNGRIVLHFLPPYCPNENRIERVWKDVHDNVTRNHQCPDMCELMAQVRHYLRRRNRRTERQNQRVAA